MFYLNVR